MRVLMAANWWYRRGGLGAVMLDEAAGLTERGHEVIPFASAHPQNLSSPWSRFFPPFTETAEGGLGLGPFRRATAVIDLIHNRTASRLFGQLLDTARPDIVHLHNPSRQLSPSVVGAAVRRRIPVVMTLHDYALICPQGFLLKGNRAPCGPPNCVHGVVIHAVANRCVKDSVLLSGVAATEHLIHRAAGSYVRRASRFIAPSRFLAQTVAHAGIDRRRIVFLPNGLRPGPEPEAPPTEGGHILFAGTLARAKGVGTLLDAARLTPTIRYVVAGDGPDGADLRSGAPENVEFVGHQDPGPLERLRAMAVAVAAPSLGFENAQLAILEAMRSGRPVVTTAIGGQVELLEEGGGILLPVADATALAGALQQLWSDRSMASEMGRAGRRSAVDRFDLDRHLDGLLEIYREVID